MAKKKGNKQESVFYSKISSSQIRYYSFIIILFLFLVSFFLISIPSAQAQEEFSAAVQSQITACACTQYLGTLSLFNTGTQTSHYSITTAGDAAAFVAHNPWQTVLQSGEKQAVAYYVNVPCDYTKSYTFATQIGTINGYKKELQQQITPVLCSSLQLSYVGNNAYKNCACSPTIYAIKVKNIASYTDIFSFSLDLAKEYYQVSEQSLLLLPQEEKTVYFYVKLSCDYAAAYTFTVSAEAASTKAVQQFPLYLQIDKACYQPAIEFGNLVSAIDTSLSSQMVSTVKINNIAQKHLQFVYQKSATNSFTICANTINLLPVKVKNPTTIPNKFSIDIENNQPWMFIDNHKQSLLRKYSFWLYEKQEQLVDIFFIPESFALGIYHSSLLTSLQHGKITYATPFSVTVVDCAQEKQKELVQDKVQTQPKATDSKIITPQPIVQLKQLNQTNQTAQQLEQQQQKNKQFILFMGLFLLFMLLLLLIVLLYLKYFSFQQPSEKSPMNDDAFAEEAAEETTAEKTTENAEESALIIFSESKRSKKKSKKQLAAEEKAAKEQTAAERVIAVDDEEKTEESDSKKYWYQRYIPLFIVLFIVLLLLLLLFFIQTPSFFGEKNVTKNETKNVTVAQTIQTKQVVKNITPFLNKTDSKNLTQKPLTQKELAVLTFTNRTLYMNEPYFINLSKNFKDKNNDTLSFTYTPVQNISVNITKAIALLQPELDFLGVRKIVFTASDNKGGKAKTPEITLNVIKRESLLKLKQNLVFIFIAVFILIAFILFLIFRKRDSAADEEDVEQEEAVVKKRIIRRKKR